MKSSVVTSILFFLLLLLAFPHMNEALGAQIDELGKLEETKHPDQVTVQRILRISIPRRLLASPCNPLIRGPCKLPVQPPPCKIYERCKHPPLPSSSKGTQGLGH